MDPIPLMDPADLKQLEDKFERSGVVPGGVLMDMLRKVELIAVSVNHLRQRVAEVIADDCSKG